MPDPKEKQQDSRPLLRAANQQPSGYFPVPHLPVKSIP